MWGGRQEQQQWPVLLVLLTARNLLQNRFIWEQGLQGQHSKKEARGGG
jgi:hypothetical protein